VVDRLVRAGQRVRTMTRHPRKVVPRAGVDVVQGDFRRPETWPAVLDGVERIYLFPRVSQAEQTAAIGVAMGEAVRFEELSPQQARDQWMSDGYDRQTADWMVELLAAAVDGPELLVPTDTYQEITGRRPRTFAEWAFDHATDFRPLTRTGEAA
jgi:hypothetical protein